MPWLCAVDVWSTTFASEDVVQHDVQRDKLQLVVEERGDAHFGSNDEQGGNDATNDAHGSRRKCIPGADHGEDELLQQKWNGKSHRKRPSKYAADSKPEDALSSLQSSSPVYESCHPEHGGVHGEAGGEVGGGSTEHAWTENHGHEEEHSNARVECYGHNAEELGLGDSTEGGEHIADIVELGDLI